MGKYSTKILCRNHDDFATASHISNTGTLHTRLSLQEWLADLQLWAGVSLIQLFQLLLPAGELFNPILDEILQGMNFVQSKQFKEIQLNSQATGFVNYIRDELGFEGQLSITGSSLGGGVSLITGAQTKIPAISFGGPGAIFTRKSFDPVLDVDTINSLLFNVITDRDYVPIVSSEAFR